MAYFKWFFRGLLVLLTFAFFHYTLAQNDVVRIVSTDIKRQELTDWTRVFWSKPDAQSTNLTNRDVQFIHAVRPNGETMEYRNEDTGWAWPPYFKFDTASLYTEANDAISTKDEPEWVAIRHYGWRNEFLSIFPNAVSIKPVAGPEVTFVPWWNIFILTVLFGIFWGIRVRWVRFREARIDPVLEDVGDSFADASDSIAHQRGRLSRWFGQKKK